MSSKRTVTVVVPVYGDWSSLSECIKSLNEHLDRRHTVMLVNDCGPDVELMENNIQKAIKGMPNFLYYRNPENLGFVRSCNRAVLELEKSRNDILLLNSDTKVTEGFLEEMLEVLYATPKIGAVSPRSNNATIATIPLSSANQKGIGAIESYKVFQKMKSRLPQYSIAPVAHGFCMLIRRDLIKMYGLFDPVFGKGYGEEVDFCLRIKRHGYLSALSNHAFVYHLEARSFTHEIKAKLLENNNKIIDARYPNYRSKTVRNYINQALIDEEGIYHAAVHQSKKQLKTLQSAKALLRRNPTLYSLAQKAYSVIRRQNVL